MPYIKEEGEDELPCSVGKHEKNVC